MANKQLPQLFTAVFSTPDGQEVLEHLRKSIVEQEIFSTQTDGMQTAMLLARRSGENNVVRYIERLVEQGRKPVVD